MGTLLHDFRYALRMLARNPAFTAVAVLTLALGIGANTAIFSVINAVLLRPLPFREPDRLVQLWETETAPGNYPLSGPDYVDWKAQTRTLEGMTLYLWPVGTNVSGAGEPEQASYIRTEANFFQVVGVEPLLGRGFLPGEDQPGQNHVAVLSYGFWQRHFGAEKDVVGKSLELDAEKYTVVGVMPAWFRSVGRADLWVPMEMTPKTLGMRGNHSFRGVARTKRGVTLAQARAELETVAKRLEKQYPDSNTKVGAIVIPLKEQMVGDTRPQLLILLAAVGLVLLIACANVANLLLVRATGRHREIAVRRALGAGRARIVGQLLTESVLLSLLGGLLGLGMAGVSLRLLARAQNVPLPQPNPIALDGTVLLFTFGVSLLAGVLFGLAPAWQVSQLHLNEELKATAQAVLSPSGRRRLLRDALVAGEIAISLAVLVGAGLLLRSFARLREVQTGFQPQGVLTAQIVLPARKYATLEQSRAFYQQLLERLESAPGVRGAAIASELPLEGGSNGYIKIPGKDKAAFEKILVEWDPVSPDYFRTLGIPFLKGRNFTNQDFQDTAESSQRMKASMEAGKKPALEEAKLVAIVNATMAKTFWPGEDALGRTFMAGGAPVTVVGVVGDVNIWGLREAVIPEAYFPASRVLVEPGWQMNILVKSAAAPELALPALRNQVRELDSSLALFHDRRMEEVVSDAMGDTRLQTLLLGFFAGLALTLTAVGIYGVMAYTVSQRRREIGIRMALGAQRREVLRLVMGQGAKLALVGVATGVVSALAATRLMSSLLFGIGARDPLTFVAVIALLMAVALLACYLPARRATRVDPLVALRYE